MHKIDDELLRISRYISEYVADPSGRDPLRVLATIAKNASKITRKEVEKRKLAMH